MWFCCCDTDRYYNVGRCNTSGEIEWAMTGTTDLNGASTAAAAGFVSNLFVDSSDNIYFLSSKDENGNNSSYGGDYIHKVNSSGARQWTIDIKDDRPTDATVFVSGPGGIKLFAGDSSGNTYIVWQGSGPKAWIVKYDSTGSASWTSNEIYNDISTNTGTTTEKQSVDLSTVTEVGVETLQLTSSGPILWFDVNSSGTRQFYFHGVEYDTSGSYSRTYTAFSVSSSPARADMADSRGTVSKALSDGSFYSGIEDYTQNELWKNDANELLEWSDTIASITGRQAIASQEGYGKLEPSTDDLWLPSSSGYTIYDEAAGTTSSLSSIGEPYRMDFKANGNILHSSSSTAPTGVTDNCREITTSGTVVRNYAWPSIATVREMSSNECAVGGSAVIVPSSLFV